VEKFAAFIKDAKAIVAASKDLFGIQLAGWDGTGEPVVTDELIALNGLSACGHTHEDLGITWPAPMAGGVSDPEFQKPITEGWFAGALLNERRCGGDCSHETFRIERVMPPNSWDPAGKDGLHFDCTKTAYKPYDLTVTALLVAAKHHFGDRIRLSSDGEDGDWTEGKAMCQVLFGYGRDFTLRDGFPDDEHFTG